MKQSASAVCLLSLVCSGNSFDASSNSFVSYLEPVATINSPSQCARFVSQDVGRRNCDLVGRWLTCTGSPPRMSAWFGILILCVSSSLLECIWCWYDWRMLCCTLLLMIQSASVDFFLFWLHWGHKFCRHQVLNCTERQKLQVTEKDTNRADKPFFSLWLQLKFWGWWHYCATEEVETSKYLTSQGITSSTGG